MPTKGCGGGHQTLGQLCILPYASTVGGVRVFTAAGAVLTLVACQDGASVLRAPPVEAPPAPTLDELGLDATLVTLVHGGPRTLQAVSLDDPETVLNVAPTNLGTDALQEDILVHPEIWSAGAQDRFEVSDGRDQLLFEAQPGTAPRLLARRPYDLLEDHLPPPSEQEVAWFDGQVHLRSLDDTAGETQTFDVGEAHGAVLVRWTNSAWAAVTADRDGGQSLWRVSPGVPAQLVSDDFNTTTSVLNTGAHLVLWHHSRPNLATVDFEGTLSTLDIGVPVIPLAQWQDRLLLRTQSRHEVLLLDLGTGEQHTLPSGVTWGSWPSYGEAPVIAAAMEYQPTVRIVDLRTKTAHSLSVQGLGRVDLVPDPARSRLLALSLELGLVSALDLQSGAILRQWSAPLPRTRGAVLGPRGRWLAHGTTLIDLHDGAYFILPAAITHITARFAYLEPPTEPHRLFEHRPGTPRRLLGALTPFTDAVSYPEHGVVLIEAPQVGLRLLRPGSQSPEIWRGPGSVINHGVSGDRIWVYSDRGTLLWLDMSTEPPQVSESALAGYSVSISWPARRSALARSGGRWFEVSPDAPPHLLPSIPADAWLQRAGERGVWVRTADALARLNDEGALEPTIPVAHDRSIGVIEVVGSAYLVSDLPSGETTVLGVDLTGDSLPTPMPPEALWYWTRRASENLPSMPEAPIDGMGRLLSINNGRLLAFSVHGTQQVLLEPEHPLTWMAAQREGWLAFASHAGGTEIWAGIDDDARHVGHLPVAKPKSVVWLNPGRASVLTSFDESLIVDIARGQSHASQMKIFDSINPRFVAGHEASRALKVLDMSSGQSTRLDPLSVGWEFLVLAQPRPAAP